MEDLKEWTLTSGRRKLERVTGVSVVKEEDVAVSEVTGEGLIGIIEVESPGRDLKR